MNTRRHHPNIVAAKQCCGSRSLGVLLVILVSVAAGQEPARLPILAASAERSVTERVTGRTFPSVFQAWSPAQNVRDESPLHCALAEHDRLASNADAQRDSAGRDVAGWNGVANAQGHLLCSGKT